LITFNKILEQNLNILLPIEEKIKIKKPVTIEITGFFLTGAVGLEPTTSGFGEPRTYIRIAREVKNFCTYKDLSRRRADDGVFRKYITYLPI